MSNTTLLKRPFADGGLRSQNREMLHPSPPSLLRPRESPIGEKEFFFRYLREEIFPQIVPPPYGEIDIQTLSYRKPVYLFQEELSNVAVVGKLFKNNSVSLQEAWLSAEREYFNLRLLRERFGMDSDTCRVVAPLGKKKELCALVVTERAAGRMLDYYIAKAAHEGQHQPLFEKLGYLAKFFATLHRNTERNRQVSTHLTQWYLCKLLDSLCNGLLSPSERYVVETHAAKWFGKKSTFTVDREVIVHGDATPTNFLLHGQEVVAIDLERMKCADRCWDLGFIAAELKHHFMWRIGNGWAAEPFIGHFLREYAADHNADTQSFRAVTRRIPFYMALGLLRIARNDWLDGQYRRGLLVEAKRCLKYGL